MANIDAKLGLRPMEGQNLRARRFPVVAADSSAAIFKNDPVALQTSGGVKAGAGAGFLGAVLDIYDTDMVPVSYLTASTAGYVVAATNPMLRYQIQCSGTLTASSVGDCADLVANAGNTGTGQSAYELSSTLKGAGTSGNMRILGLVERADNVWGAQSDVVVVANQNALVTTPVAI